MISSTDVQDVVVQLNCDKIVLKGQDIETFLEDVKGKIQISEGGSSTSPSGLQIQDIEGLSAELNKKVEQDALETLVNTSVETALEPLDMKISSEVQEELTLQMKTYEETFDEKIQTAIDSITIDENAVKEIISENFNDNLVNDTSFKSLQSSIPTEENIKTIASDNFNDNLVNNEAFKAVKAKAEEVPIIKTSQISDRVTVDENDTSGVPTVNACELVISEAQEQVYEKFDQFLDKSLVSDSTQKVTWVFEPENTNTDWVLTVDDDYYLIISPSQSVTWTNISGTISIKSALGTDSLNFNTADAYNEEASEDVISYTQNAPKTLKIFLYKLTPNNIPVSFTINLTNLMNDTTALPNVTISEFKVNNSVQIPSLSCVNDKLENEYLSKQYVINDKELDYVFTWAKEDGPLSPCYLYEYDQDNKQIVITVTDNILGGGGSEYWYKVTGPYDASIGWSDEAQETVQVTSRDLTNETYFENWSVHYDFSLHPGYITAKYNFDLEAAMGVEDTYFFEHGFFSVMYLEGKYSRRYLTCPTNITVTRVKKSSVQHTYLDGEKTSWEMVGYSSRNSENDVTFEWNFFLDDGVLKAYPLDTSETITGQISRRYLSGELGSTATFDTSTAYVENEAVFWKQNDPSSLRLVFCKPDDEKAEQIYTMRLQISSLGNWWQVIYCRLRKRDIQLVSSAYFHDRLNNLQISDINLLEDELQYLEEEVGKVKTQNPFKGKYISILGDSISTFKGYLPSDHKYTYPKGDVTSVSQTWWGLLINALEAKLCVNCAYSGARVANKDGETYLGQHIFDLSRDAGVAYLELDGSTTTPEAAVFPDIVIIFAGINDATNNTEITDARSDTLQGSEFTTDFTNSFRKTLWETNKYIKKDGGKNADIYCVLLPQFSMWGTTNTLKYNMVDYNKAIKDCCDLWGFPYLDLSKIATFPEVEDDISLGDQTHPNAKGMKIIASFMKREMMRYPPQRSSINEIII